MRRMIQGDESRLRRSQQQRPEGWNAGLGKFRHGWMQRLQERQVVSWEDGLMQAFGRDEAIADALLLHTPKAVFNK